MLEQGWSSYAWRRVVDWGGMLNRFHLAERIGAHPHDKTVADQLKRSYMDLTRQFASQNDWIIWSRGSNICISFLSTQPKKAPGLVGDLKYAEDRIDLWIVSPSIAADSETTTSRNRQMAYHAHWDTVGWKQFPYPPFHHARTYGLTLLVKMRWMLLGPKWDDIPPKYFLVIASMDYVCLQGDARDWGSVNR